MKRLDLYWKDFHYEEDLIFVLNVWLSIFCPENMFMHTVYQTVFKFTISFKNLQNPVFTSVILPSAHLIVCYSSSFKSGCQFF